jgi:hypothetical protein
MSVFLLINERNNATDAATRTVASSCTHECRYELWKTPCFASKSSPVEPTDAGVRQGPGQMQGSLERVA